MIGDSIFYLKERVDTLDTIKTLDIYSLYVLVSHPVLIISLSKKLKIPEIMLVKKAIRIFLNQIFEVLENKYSDEGDKAELIKYCESAFHRIPLSVRKKLQLGTEKKKIYYYTLRLG